MSNNYQWQRHQFPNAPMGECGMVGYRGDPESPDSMMCAVRMTLTKDGLHISVESDCPVTIGIPDP